MKYKARFVEYLYKSTLYISSEEERNYAQELRHVFCHSWSESFKIIVGKITFILRLTGDKVCCIIKDGYY